MSQISPPIRIVLVSAIAFLAAWMLFLRPKADDSTSPAPTPAPNLQTGAAAKSAPGKAAQAAQQAVAKANGASDAVDKASGGQAGATQGATRSGTAAAPTTKSAQPAQPALPTVDGAVLAKLPKPVAHALQAHKVLVLGVINSDAKPWAPMADDDRSVRNTLRHVNRYKGDVVVQTVPLANLSRYAPVINGVQVTQSPAVVVVDRKLKATRVDGWLDRVSINQVISDARRASTDPLIADAYLRKVNDYCGHYFLDWSRFSLPTVRGADQRFMARLSRHTARWARGFAAIKAPARWRGLRTQMLTALRKDAAATKRLEAAYKHKDVKGIKAALASVDPEFLRTLDRRLDRVGLTNCVSNRRS